MIQAPSGSSAAKIREQLPRELQAAKPWTTRARLQGVTADRQKELLDLAFLCSKSALLASGLPANDEDVIKGLVVDMSQNCVRPLGRKVCCAVHLLSFKKLHLYPCWLSVSHLKLRKPWGHMRCYTTSSLIYSFEADRVLLPEEGFRLLGFPYIDFSLSGLTGQEIAGLVGQAMAVPSVTLACMALLAAAAQANHPGLFGPTAPRR